MTSGLRFTDLPIPQGAIISKAFVQFEAIYDEDDSCEVAIKAEDANDAATFSWTANDISSRTTTTAGVSSWYPEGNWVKIPPGTPYHIIGERGYGKPVLDRALKYDDSLRFALKVGCLAFDSTRISASDVDFPIDVVLYMSESHELVEHRYEQADLADISSWWQDRLRQSVYELPSEWIDNVASKLQKIKGEGLFQME